MSKQEEVKWTEPQVTKEQCETFYQNKMWEKMNDVERAWFQINQKLLCMPFGVFHEAVEKTLKRSVRPHEFGMNLQGIREEMAGKCPKPNMTDIINLIPTGKLILVTV